ncbi:hypothetical protein [Microbulbifer yueqingensis]|uniref:Uncharacterized protein n=1 Tax=Microbulbifer yueqingensis TaxID=658219 RepID=A0A1G9BRJ0_9GAMM|nr:hypothetical protein [Microbulbifer yueqingensis]SDK42111.1 hypothetical protein SAMN05216212_2340 [Microbulbifer yueqingensis]
MKTPIISGTSFLSLSLTLALALSVATSPPAAVAEQQDIGSVSFSTSCSRSVQADFNRAVALLHHMMYVQSHELFADIARRDPDCAMAYWGIAMTALHPLWAPPPAEALARGQEALRKAREISPETAREKAYIEAASAFYQDWDKTRHRKNLEAWSAAQQQLYERFPDDVDAGALYALSLVATAPKEDKDYTHQKAAGKILERLRGKAPRHPAMYHYLIHAYDNPALAGRALEVAREYDKIAPEVPHALHMPSHIFVRQGIWPDTIDWNKRSAAAARRQPAEGKTSLHYYHALDYLLYAYLQQGRKKEAKATIAELQAAAEAQDEFASAYGIAASRARYPLENRDWRGAAALDPRVPGSFPWDKYPWTEAVVEFARGIGAARSGDSAAAVRSAGRLGELQEQTAAAGEQYWARQVKVQQLAVQAWAELSAGDQQQARALMREAADMEDSMDKHPVTPGPVLPARELLGDMLLASNKPREAVEAYRAALEVNAGRFNSLYGAARAAAEIGDNRAASKFYQELLDQAGEYGSREEIARARKFMEQQ